MLHYNSALNWLNYLLLAKNLNERIAKTIQHTIICFRINRIETKSILTYCFIRRLLWSRTQPDFAKLERLNQSSKFLCLKCLILAAFLANCCYSSASQTGSGRFLWFFRDNIHLDHISYVLESFEISMNCKILKELYYWYFSLLTWSSPKHAQTFVYWGKNFRWLG